MASLNLFHTRCFFMFELCLWVETDMGVWVWDPFLWTGTYIRALQQQLSTAGNWQNYRQNNPWWLDPSTAPKRGETLSSTALLADRLLVAIWQRTVLAHNHNNTGEFRETLERGPHGHNTHIVTNNSNISAGTVLLVNGNKTWSEWGIN